MSWTSGMDENVMDHLFDYCVPGEILLQNLSDADALLAESQENSLSTLSYLEPYQEPQSNGIVCNSSATGALPSVSTHLGEYNFEAHISAEAGAPDCLYSQKLNKIFVNMDKTVPVLFRVNKHVQGLYVRALAVYASSSDIEYPVQRCPSHTASDTEGNKDIDLVEHVLRCISPNAVYYKANDSGRLSVRVALDAPQSGTDFVKICYKFTCLSSCQTRRKTGIIFTLEDEMGGVLGRQFMYVRVCSCPRRDKDKEETPKEKRLSSGTRPAKKFLKSDPEEIPVVTVPVKLCHIKELAKFACDLIYRDIGMEQRTLTEQEKEFITYYRRIIETPDEELHKLISSH